MIEIEDRVKEYVSNLIKEAIDPGRIPAMVKELLTQTGQYAAPDISSNELLFSALVKGLDEDKKVQAVLLEMRKIELWRGYYWDFKKGEPVFKSEPGIPYRELEENYEQIYAQRIMCTRCNIAEYSRGIPPGSWQEMIHREFQGEQRDEYRFADVLSCRFMLLPLFVSTQRPGPDSGSLDNINLIA
ncbi:MAG: hypothetical protein GY940_17955 [bacterium]|nr:hypothetical protein [bacterium]